MFEKYNSVRIEPVKFFTSKHWDDIKTLIKTTYPEYRGMDSIISFRVGNKYVTLNNIFSLRIYYLGEITNKRVIGVCKEIESLLVDCISKDFKFDLSEFTDTKNIIICVPKDTDVNMIISQIKAANFRNDFLPRTSEISVQ